MGFERIKYPDGQISVKWEGNDYPKSIRERINSYEDLIYIRSIADIINSEISLGNTLDYKLYIPCLFGQRSDVRFSSNQSFDLKIIAEIINICNFGRVEVFDPHSNVSIGMINRSAAISPFDYVKQTIEAIQSRDVDERGTYQGDLLLVSPDAGAYKKVFDYGEKLNFEVVAAVKHRDKKGKIDLTFMGNVKNRDCLIVDDLCDGGYTFELLGKALKDNGAKNLYLYVSHGIFTKGFMKLTEIYNHIYCTNSVKDIDLTITETFTGTELSNFLTQFSAI